MKKTPLIISVIALVGAIALLIVGFYGSNPTITGPSIEVTNPNPNPSTPTEPTKLNVPSGTYYYVLGTHTARGFEDHKAADNIEILPCLMVNDNQYFFRGEAADAAGIAYLNGDTIIFENPQDVQNAMPISVEHDDFWYQIYYPRQTKDWTCTYNAETQTITITHNSDFVQFKYFDTPEDCLQYLREQYLKDGYIELYPTPERIPVFDDPTEEPDPDKT